MGLFYQNLTIVGIETALDGQSADEGRETINRSVVFECVYLQVTTAYIDRITGVGGIDAIGRRIGLHIHLTVGYLTFAVKLDTIDFGFRSAVDLASPDVDVGFVVDADEIKPVKAKPSYRKESGGEWRVQGNTGIDEPRNERGYWGIFS